MKKVFLLMFLMISFQNCTKDIPEKDYSDSLTGQWRLFMTCGGFSGACNDVSPNEPAHDVVFSHDSVFYVFVGDSLVNSDSYSITLKQSCKHCFGQFHTSGVSYSFWLQHDTLGLIIGSSDFSRSYKRIR